MLKGPKYWRVYYRIQELLEREFISSYDGKGSVGDVREASCFPQALNSEADKIAQYLMNIHNEIGTIDERDSHLIELRHAFTKHIIEHRNHMDKLHVEAYEELHKPKPRVFDNWHLVLITKEEYHNVVNELEASLRPMIDSEVVADNYYVAMTNDFNETLGGFTTSSNGYLGGFFSLVKGFGKQLYKKRLEMARNDLSGGYDTFTLTCFGNYLNNYYYKLGFHTTVVREWNEEYAPKDWNYEKWGRPHVYEMEMKV